jgi:hypothetical protein
MHGGPAGQQSCQHPPRMSRNYLEKFGAPADFLALSGGGR